MPPHPRPWSLHAALCAIGAALFWAATAHFGPRAISDDDFARVVISQRFAVHPTLDPSGTSWLPVPFYLDGLWLMLFGGTLDAARSAAGARSVVASLCLFVAAREWGLRAWLGLLVAWMPFALPTVRILTVATVPEYLTGALTLLSVSLLVTPNRRRPVRSLVGLSALLLATLSRYEAWPIALILVGFLALKKEPGLALFGLVGPGLWLTHGALHHGDALFFAVRVAKYKAALAGVTEPWWSLLAAYPESALRFEPLLMVLALGAAFSLHRYFKEDRVWLTRSLIIALSVLALSIANLKGGAPTHHPERAVTLVWLTAPFLPALLLERFARLTRDQLRHLTVTALLASIVGLIATRSRPQAFYPGRAHEIAAGEALAKVQEQPELTLVASTDYGYFAIMAAAGNPDRFIIARDNDPRNKSAEDSLGDAVRTAFRTHPSRWMVIPICLDFISAEFAEKLEIRAETEDFMILGPKRMPASK